MRRLCSREMANAKGRSFEQLGGSNSRWPLARRLPEEVGSREIRALPVEPGRCSGFDRTRGSSSSGAQHCRRSANEPAEFFSCESAWNGRKAAAVLASTTRRNLRVTTASIATGRTLSGQRLGRAMSSIVATIRICVYANSAACS